MLTVGCTPSIKGWPPNSTQFNRIGDVLTPENGTETSCDSAATFVPPTIQLPNRPAGEPMARPGCERSTAYGKIGRRVTSGGRISAVTYVVGRRWIQQIQAFAPKGGDLDEDIRSRVRQVEVRLGS